MKIWNLNKFSGVIGVFNCQGAGNWTYPVKENAHVPTTVCITGDLSPSDVELLEEIAGDDWNGETAVFAFNSCKFHWTHISCNCYPSPSSIFFTIINCSYAFRFSLKASEASDYGGFLVYYDM